MNVYKCYANFNEDIQYHYNVSAKSLEEADRAFQQHVYEERFLTKSCAKKWSIEIQ